MRLELTIYGRPATAKNGLSFAYIPKLRRTITYKKPSLKRWEEDALKQITGKHRLGINSPVNVRILVYPYIDGRADLNGYSQAVDDMLVRAGVLADDSAWKPRIVVGHDGSRIAGIDKKNPRVEITITPIE